MEQENVLLVLGNCCDKCLTFVSLAFQNGRAEGTSYGPSETSDGNNQCVIEKA